jgi:hypothetical protein
VHEVEHAMRQALVELCLTSTAPARAFVPVVSSSPPESRAPTGPASPAEHWQWAYERADTERERAAALRGARSELSHIRRRRFAVGVVRDGDDLRARILAEGGGADADVVAQALRCTPTLVRRTRVAAGRDAERGRVLDVELDARALHDAGLSLRAIALATGVARSTLHDRLSIHQ